MSLVKCSQERARAAGPTDGKTRMRKWLGGFEINCLLTISKSFYLKDLELCCIHTLIEGKVGILNHHQDQIVGGRKSFSSSAAVAAGRFIMFCRAEMKCRGREGGCRGEDGRGRQDSLHKRPPVEDACGARFAKLRQRFMFWATCYIHLVHVHVFGSTVRMLYTLIDNLKVTFACIKFIPFFKKHLPHASASSK